MGARVVWHPSALRRVHGQAALPWQAPGGVRTSPAAVLARGCGGSVTRLDGRWPALLAALPAFTELVAIVRDGALHQTLRGRVERLSLEAGAGHLAGPGLDLRVSTARWAHGFAVTGDTPEGMLRRLVFFDAEGEPVLELRLGAEVDAPGVARLVARHRHADQQPRLRAVRPAVPAVAGTADPAAVLGAGFHALFDAAGARREAILRAAGPTLARRVDPRCLGSLLHVASEQQRPLAWLAGQAAALAGFCGRFVRVEREQGRLRLHAPGFLAQIEESAITRAWVVYRPERCGPRTVLELYRAGGGLLAVLGSPLRANGQECLVWRALLLGLTGALY